jgi:hypothetical protein
MDGKKMYCTPMPELPEGDKMLLQMNLDQSLLAAAVMWACPVGSTSLSACVGCAAAASAT